MQYRPIGLPEKINFFQKNSSSIYLLFGKKNYFFRNLFFGFWGEFKFFFSKIPEKSKKFFFFDFPQKVKKKFQNKIFFFAKQLKIAQTIFWQKIFFFGHQKFEFQNPIFPDFPQ